MHAFVAVFVAFLQHFKDVFGQRLFCELELLGIVMQERDNITEFLAGEKNLSAHFLFLRLDHIGRHRPHLGSEFEGIHVFFHCASIQRCRVLATDAVHRMAGDAALFSEQ